jgi:hypothetical protein
MLKLQDEKVQDVIFEAVKAACAKLDEVFPGKDNGGINSNIAGSIEKCIEQELIKWNLAIEED